MPLFHKYGIYIIFLVSFVLLCGHSIFLCIPGWPGIQYVNQTCLKLAVILQSQPPRIIGVLPHHTQPILTLFDIFSFPLSALLFLSYSVLVECGSNLSTEETEAGEF